MTILDEESSSIGATEIKTSWVIEYNRGAYTATEYGELVAGTVESRRDPSEVGATPDG